MDLYELRELEAQRLERAHALMIFKEQAATSGAVLRAKSGLGVRRHGLGPAEGRDSSSDDAGADPRPPAVLPVRHADDEAPPLPPLRILRTFLG